MKWGAYIKRTAVRRVVWILIGVLVYAGLGAFSDARAQDYSNCDTTTQQNGYCPDRGTAYSMSRGLAENLCANYNNATYECLGVSRSNHFQGGSSQRRWWGYQSYFEFRHKTTGNVTEQASSARFYGSGCPAGEEWRDDLGRCFDPSECLARNQQDGFGVFTTRPWRSECVAGCSLGFDNNQGVVCTTMPNGAVSCAGSLQWSGDQCTATPGSPPVQDAPPTRPDKATCSPAGAGQTFCIKPSGEQCYTASNGREVCWSPTETGEKSDRDVLQKRNAGNTEIPPSNPNLPNGDVLEKSGESITTETTRTQGDTSSTTTTTTTNYQTQYGTNPGAGDQGSPSDGSGGEGDSETGSIDGGGDCETPPVGRGGDAQLVAVVNQAWATRCAVEAGNAAKVTGDVADCSSPFTVEGTNANAVKLRAMREQICKEGEKASNEGVSSGLDAEINAMEGEYSVSDVWGDGSGEGSLVTTRYGGGGGSCPLIEVTIPVINQTWTAPAAFCSLIAALRLLFITVATVWGLRIIGS